MESKARKEEGSGAGNGSRWQPTKEQIDILEGVYSAGVKTPSAEQIQQITARLSAFGHIEGKNVFYWFQNTKARRRQKQRQDRFAYLTRFCHVPPPPSHPHGGLYCYHHPYEQVAWAPPERKTLELFPLQPGGNDMSSSGASSPNSGSDHTSDEYSDVQGGGGGGGGFIDFFSARSDHSCMHGD